MRRHLSRRPHARCAEQLGEAFNGAGAVLVDAPFHTIAGEEPGITIPTTESTDAEVSVQSALSKAFHRTARLLISGGPLTVNNRPADLVVMIGLKTPKLA